MQRDIELIKKILLLTRDKNPKDTCTKIDIEGYDPQIINEYIKLLAGANLLEYQDRSYIGHREYCSKNLTMRGHDYLEYLLTPWYKKAILKLLEGAGKVIWVVVSSLVSGVLGFLIGQYFQS